MEELSEQIKRHVREHMNDAIKQLESGLWMVDWSSNKPDFSTYATSTNQPSSFNLLDLEKIKEAMGKVRPVFTLIPSIHACKYKTKTIVTGIADRNKPNQKKMLYRRKKITTMIPLIYRVGDMVIYHPILEAKLRRMVDEYNQKRNT